MHSQPVKQPANAVGWLILDCPLRFNIMQRLKRAAKWLQTYGEYARSNTLPPKWRPRTAEDEDDGPPPTASMPEAQVGWVVWVERVAWGSSLHAPLCVLGRCCKPDNKGGHLSLPS